MNIAQSIMLTAVVVICFCILFGKSEYTKVVKSDVSETKVEKTMSFSLSLKKWAGIMLEIALLIMFIDALWMIWVGGGK